MPGFADKKQKKALPWQATIRAHSSHRQCPPSWVSWQTRPPEPCTRATHKTSVAQPKCPASSFWASCHSLTAETELSPLFLFPKHHTPQFFPVSPKWGLRYKSLEENQPYLASAHILWCWSCSSFRGVTLYLHHPEGKEKIWLFSSSIPFPSTWKAAYLAGIMLKSQI